MTTESRPWTQEMVIVHRVFRREFRLMAARVGALPPSDSDGVKRVAEHTLFGLKMLEHHHGLEDELVWPRLRVRCAVQADLVQRMEDQHHRVERVVQRVLPELQAWRTSPTPATTAPLASSLIELSDALDEHLAEEEAQILPLIQEYLTVDEWGEVGHRAQGAIPPPKRLFALGLLMEEATPAEETQFLRLVPALPRMIYKVLGRSMYANQSTRLRGTG